jgi:O-antigen/teichoic acid export membrane protein
VFGQYGFGIALITLFAVLSDKGLNTYQTRQTAFHSDKNLASKLISDALYARLILGIGSFIVLFIISALISEPASFRIFFRLVALAMAVNFLMGSFSSALLGFERFKLYGVLAMGTQLLQTVLSFIALYLRYELIGIGAVNLLVALIATLAVGYAVNKRVCSFSLKGSFVQGLAIIKSALPLTVTGVLMTVYYRADFVMLSIMKGDAAVGYYNSAYALINGLLLVSTSFSATVLPRMSGYFRESAEQMMNLYQAGFKYMLYFGLAAAVGVLFVAEPIYMLFYPQAYLPGALTLKILIWAMALMFVNSLQSGLLIATDLKKLLMYLAAVGAVTNIGLNLILIPAYSFNGAAVATLVSELVTGLGFFIILKSQLPFSRVAIWVLRFLPAGLIMILVLWILPSLNVVLRILAGAAAVIMGLLITKGLDKTDIKYVLRLLPGGQG